jgi:phosphohistidine phosphatase
MSRIASAGNKERGTLHLYLARHGTPLDKADNPRRPLSEAGRDDVRRVADFLGRLEDHPPTAVVHSGKDRARETAELLAERLAPSLVPQPTAGLGPTDPVPPFRNELAAWDQNTLVVGHLPFLARLAGLLVAEDEERAVAAFGPGSILALQPAEEGSYWQVSWMIGPEHLI